MYAEPQLDGLGFSLSKSLKKLRKSVKKRITIWKPKEILKTIGGDFARVQSGINKVIAPNAEKRAKEAAKLQAQAEAEEDAANAEALSIEQARRQQLISSGITLGGLGIGGLILFTLLRRK